MVLQSMIPKKDKNFIIVLGNEKGGTGKSTISMHLAVYLLRMGFTAGTIDADARQGTLTRYIENRLAYAKMKNIPLLSPYHCPLYRSQKENREEAESEDKQNFMECMSKLEGRDFIIIDTPGTDTYLSRLTHSYADLLITPLNDSFIDLDMIGRVDLKTGVVIRPSTYAEMVWDQKKARALRRESSFEWIVMRNRLSTIKAKNKEDMKKALSELAKRIGFKVSDGFSERVVFRELFLMGLTVLDLEDTKLAMNFSHLAARQELRKLLEMIALPQIEQRLATAS